MKVAYAVPKTAFGMLGMACLGLLALSGSTPAQQGPSGYHLIKTLKIDGPGGWDYLGIDSQSRRLFISHGTHVVVLDADTALSRATLRTLRECMAWPSLPTWAADSQATASPTM